MDSIMNHAEVTLETTPDTAALDEALAHAQGEIANAVKDKVNPAFRSKYADLAAVFDACRPALAKHLIAVTQWPLSSSDNRLHIITRIAHKGQWMQARFAIPVDKANAHGVGSACTYARRFALSAALGIAPDDGSDDDGNAASHKPGAPGTAGAGTQFRPERRASVPLDIHGHPHKAAMTEMAQSSANGRRIAADEPHLVDATRPKGTLAKPEAADGNGNAIRRIQWCRDAEAIIKSANTKDELSEWWEANADRLGVIETALPQEHERLIVAFDDAMSRVTAKVS